MSTKAEYMDQFVAALADSMAQELQAQINEMVISGTGCLKIELGELVIVARPDSPDKPEIRQKLRFINVSQQMINALTNENKLLRERLKTIEKAVEVPSIARDFE